MDTILVVNIEIYKTGTSEPTLELAIPFFFVPSPSPSTPTPSFDSSTLSYIGYHLPFGMFSQIS